MTSKESVSAAAAGQVIVPPAPTAGGIDSATTADDPSVTDWISAALAQRPERGSIQVDGARIAYRAWGDRPGRDVLLVHGGGAHSGWWDHLGPLLAEDGRVAALDLSGHGDSDHRDEYDVAVWGSEVLAVREVAGLNEDCVVVGHSLGGLITLFLRGQKNAGIRHAVIVDSPLEGPEAQRLPEAGGFVSRRRVYPTLDEAVARFRAVPPQASLLAVHHHIAAESIRQDSDGWTWKFDARIFNGAAHMRTTRPERGERLAFLRGEHGMVPPSACTLVQDVGGLALDLPGAGHAPMLDQPGALLGALRAIIAGWKAASGPHFP